MRWTRKKTPQADAAPESRQIIVRQSALDSVETAPDRLLGSVVDYVNFLVETAHLNPDDVPMEALQSYYTDFYLSEVRYGGHAQFLINAQDQRKQILVFVGDGLIAMGARDHFRIFAQAARWSLENAALLDNDDFFDRSQAPVIEALDQPFLALNDETDLIGLNARWIAGLPNVVGVADDQWDAAMRDSCGLQAHSPDHDPAARIAHVNDMLTSPVALGLGICATAMRPSEALVGIGRQVEKAIVGHFAEPWEVRTNRGIRFGVVFDEGTALFDALPPPKQGVSPEVGEQLMRVRVELINQARDVCQQSLVAPMIDLLLSRAPEEVDFDFASVHSAGPADGGDPGEMGAVIFLACDGGRSLYVATILKGGKAELIREPGRVTIATASWPEIEQHAARYA